MMYHRIDWETGQTSLCSWEEGALLFAQDEARRVAKTRFLRDGETIITVSTVFLVIDHSFGRGQLPVLFETMVFGGQFDEHQERYCTLAEARAGHEEMVRLVRISLKGDHRHANPDL